MTVTFFYLVFAFFVASMALMYLLVRSPFGRSLAGIRERELRMQILGYNTWLHKYIIFIIAGGFGGLSGVLWAHTNGHVSPETLVLTTSVDSLLMVVLGGAGTLVGACFGAAIVFGLREYLSTLVPWWQYALGGVYVLTILYLPMGLDGHPRPHSPALDGRKERRRLDETRYQGTRIRAFLSSQKEGRKREERHEESFACFDAVRQRSRAQLELRRPTRTNCASATSRR